MQMASNKITYSHGDGYLYACHNKNCQFYNKKGKNPKIQVMNYDHHLIVTCTKCARKWKVCTCCSKRWNTNNFYAANEHFVTSCPGTIEILHRDHNNNESSLNGRALSNSESSTSSIYTKSYRDPVICNSSLPTKSQKYFQNELQEDYSGIKGIVAQSFDKYELRNDLTLSETAYHMKVASFCNQLTESQRYSFANILHETLTQPFTSTSIPKSIHDLNVNYTSGQRAILPNLPVPTSKSNYGHAYVSLVSVINHFLAFGYKTEFSFLNEPHYSNTGIQSTNIAKQIKRNVKKGISDDINPLILYITFWSDDFEPNQHRKTKGSMWIKTVTICPPSNMSTSPKYTYILALSKKGIDHDVINDIFNKELKELSKCSYRYHGKIKKNIPVIVEVLAVLADRPERCSMNSLLQHNGVNTKRWRYSAYIDYQYLPSCLKCFVQNLSYMKKIQSSCKISKPMVEKKCLFCNDYNYSKKGSSTLPQPPPDNYPTHEAPNSPNSPHLRSIKDNIQLSPCEITYDWLKEGCIFAFHNVYNNFWSIRETISYLKSLGINESFGRIQIYEKAHSCAKNKETNPLEIQDYISHIKFPSIWNMGIGINQCVDTPMHLLFQGINKTLIEYIFYVLVEYQHAKQFKNSVNGLLKQIKTLNCCFCRVEPFFDKKVTAGWIAENHLGMARIFSTIFNKLEDIFSEDSLIIKTVLFDIKCCIHAWNCLISRIMARYTYPKHELEVLIKIFLNLFRLLEENSGVKPNQEFLWITRGNILSMLNLPQQIDTFGNIRYYWEGSRERFIQSVKPFLQNLRDSESYLKLQLDRIQQSNLLTHLLEDLNIDTGQKRYDRYRNIKIYPSKSTVLESVGKNESLFLLRVLTGRTFSLICLYHHNNTRRIHIHPIHCHHDVGVMVWGQWYMPISLDINTNVTVINDIDDLKISFSSYTPVLAIPSLLNAHPQKYTLFDDEWMYMQQDESFVYPLLCDEILNYWSKKKKYPTK